MASWLMPIVSSPGKSSRNRWAICCGLHALAHCRFFRRPCPRPFQGTIGPQTAAPPEVATTPASRSCTYVCSAALTASFAGFGRRAARSACLLRVDARSGLPPPPRAGGGVPSQLPRDRRGGPHKTGGHLPYPLALRATQRDLLPLRERQIPPGERRRRGRKRRWRHATRLPKPPCPYRRRHTRAARGVLTR